MAVIPSHFALCITSVFISRCITIIHEKLQGEITKFKKKALKKAKWLSIMLAAVMVLTMIPMTAFAAETTVTKMIVLGTDNISNKDFVYYGNYNNSDIKWKVNVEYENAKTGENEYISPLLCDKDGSVLYYGNIAKNNTEGNAEVTIPTGLAIGDYKFQTISLTVKAHTCTAQGEWISDNDKHWKECTCGNRINEANHTFEWVTDKDGNPVKITDNGDGTYTFVQPYSKVTIKVSFENKPDTKPVDDTKSPQTGDNGNLT